MTQTHTQRMGPRPIFCVNKFIIEIDAKVDADTHADVTCKQRLNGVTGATSIVSVNIDTTLTSRDTVTINMNKS